MTESDPILNRRIDHPDRRKVVAFALACLAVLAAAAVTMGASPDPSGFAVTSPAPTASDEPATTAAPDASEQKPEGGRWHLRDVAGMPGFGGRGGIGFGHLAGVEITAIDGSDLSLRTVDGWTRTITVEAETVITRGDETIDVDELAVGDSIRFRQQRNDDGTFTIVRIDVVLPHVAGTVSAVSGSTMTVELPGGTSMTVHVDESTTFKVEGVTGTAGIDDIEVGMRIVAGGEQNADGSLDASRVLAGTGRLRDGHPWKGAPDASAEPGASSDPG